MDDIVAFLTRYWVVWLMAIFLAIVFWAYRPKNKKRFEEDARMIFDDDRNERSGHADKD